MFRAYRWCGLSGEGPLPGLLAEGDEDEDFFLPLVSEAVVAVSSLDDGAVAEVSVPVSVAGLLLDVASVDPALVSSLPAAVDLDLLLLMFELLEASGLLDGEA
jgi:hypothetical protein